MVKAITEAAYITLPVKKPLPLQKRQVSSNTRELYNSRKVNFEKMTIEERKQAQHSITKSIRADYQGYIDSILSAMKQAESVGNTREITRLRKQLSGKTSRSSTMPSKSKEGDPILTEKQLLECWNSFLSEKLAKLTPVICQWNQQ